MPTGLWRNKPLNQPLKPEQRPLPLKYVFPSGRSALSLALAEAGLSRANRVGFPEWSSHCLISAMGRYVTPVPFKEVVENRIKVDGVLIYEQWGWPFPAATWASLLKNYNDKIIIVDKVDSADFYLRRNSVYRFKSLIEITSLSKMLGLSGGGLAINGAKYLTFKPKLKSGLTKMLAAENKANILKNDFGYREHFQNSEQALEPNVRNWIMHNDLLAAMEQERELRRDNLRILSQGPAKSAWPQWMYQALDRGAGPGIAPLFRGEKEGNLRRVAARLAGDFKIQTALYHFNWSGNPLKPVYEKCLAFPVHGMVKGLKSVLRSLS
ncbi:hypothetical protein ACFL2I_00865 [Candidatus Omnitrophota bacterium]